MCCISMVVTYICCLWAGLALSFTNPSIWLGEMTLMGKLCKTSQTPSAAPPFPVTAKIRGHMLSGNFLLIISLETAYK